MKIKFLIVIGIIGSSLFLVSAGAYTEDNGLELNDMAVFSYVGTKSNGDQFDANSRATFTISRSGLIPGFVDGVLGMKIGETKIFDVPPERGYSEPHNLAGDTLTFEIKLLSVVGYTASVSTGSDTGFIDFLLPFIWIIIILILVFVAYSIFLYLTRKTGTKCTVCGKPYEGICSKCTKPYCRNDFGMGCRSCKNNVFSRK